MFLFLFVVYFFFRVGMFPVFCGGFWGSVFVYLFVCLLALFVSFLFFLMVFVVVLFLFYFLFYLFYFFWLLLVL